MRKALVRQQPCDKSSSSTAATSSRGAPLAIRRCSRSSRAYSRRASRRTACALSETGLPALNDLGSRYASAASAGRGEPATGTPTTARILASISAAMSGCSRSYSRVLSLPWPILSPLYAYQAPDFSMMLWVTPSSMISPSREMPSPYRMSNSGLAKRRRDLVLDDLDARLVADDFLAALDRADAADVEPHRGIELERVAAGRRLRVAEHDADLHADLVDEDHQRVGALDVAGELAQRLAHQPRLQARQLVAHLAFDLGLRHERRDRVDDDDVDAARAHQHVGDFEPLLAGVGLRDQQSRRR